MIDVGPRENSLPSERSVSLIIPTYNRAYTLSKVLPSFLSQKYITEVIIINDAGTDNTTEIINQFKQTFNHIKWIYHINEKNMGASFSRRKGLELASSDFILYCDDDDYLAENYTATCLEYLEANKADIISGRHFYLKENESLHEGKIRFGCGFSKAPLIHPVTLTINQNRKLEEDTLLPFTHGIYMAKRKLLLKYPPDPYYSKGNGFREETDSQVRAYLDDKKILITNMTYAFHIPHHEVKTGGQRVNRLSRFFFTIYYNNYFYNKYYNQLSKKLCLPHTKRVAKLLFFLSEFSRFFLRPFFLIFKRENER